ncbi:hypothetical protein JCM15124A_19190 [Prevotella falsenii]
MNTKKGGLQIQTKKVADARRRVKIQINKVANTNKGCYQRKIKGAPYSIFKMYMSGQMVTST